MSKKKKSAFIRLPSDEQLAERFESWHAGDDSIWKLSQCILTGTKVDVSIIKGSIRELEELCEYHSNFSGEQSEEKAEIENLIQVCESFLDEMAGKN